MTDGPRDADIESGVEVDETLNEKATVAKTVTPIVPRPMIRLGESPPSSRPSSPGAFEPSGAAEGQPHEEPGAGSEQGMEAAMPERAPIRPPQATLLHIQPLSAEEITASQAAMSPPRPVISAGIDEDASAELSPTPENQTADGESSRDLDLTSARRARPSRRPSWIPPAERKADISSSRPPDGGPATDVESRATSEAMARLRSELPPPVSGSPTPPLRSGARQSSLRAGPSPLPVPPKRSEPSSGSAHPPPFSRSSLPAASSERAASGYPPVASPELSAPEPLDDVVSVEYSAPSAEEVLVHDVETVDEISIDISVTPIGDALETTEALGGGIDSQAQEDEWSEKDPLSKTRPEVPNPVVKELEKADEPAEVPPQKPSVSSRKAASSLEQTRPELANQTALDVKIDMQGAENTGLPQPPIPPVENKPPPPRRSGKPGLPRAHKPRVKPWWETLFGDDFSRAYKPMSQSQLSREVDFMLESLDLAPGAVILDLGCGQGEICVELSRRGYSVVGYDLSVYQLAMAGDNAQAARQKINFLQGDMREMAFEEMFDAVICWNTTFGYFEEEKNLDVLARIKNALKPNGRLLLDVMNRDFAARESPYNHWFEGDGCICMDEMELDWITNRLKVKRSIILDDGRNKELQYSLRLYALSEFGRVLHDAGFRVSKVSGDVTTRGAFFGPNSLRLIIQAGKP